MRIAKIVLFIAMGILLAGCSTGIPAETRAMMMDSNDVPAEWIIANESTGRDWGGQLYNIAYAYGNESTAPAIEQQLIVYPGDAAAKEGFEEYKNYMFVDAWSVPPEADFSPSLSEDQFQFMCTDRELDHVMMKNCFILQQHGKYVSAVGVQMGEPLTFEVVNGILRKIDGKLGGK